MKKNMTKDRQKLKKGNNFLLKNQIIDRGACIRDPDPDKFFSGSGSGLEKIMDPNSYPVCPERMDLDPDRLVFWTVLKSIVI